MYINIAQQRDGDVQTHVHKNTIDILSFKIKVVYLIVYHVVEQP